MRWGRVWAVSYECSGSTPKFNVYPQTPRSHPNGCEGRVLACRACRRTDLYCKSSRVRFQQFFTRKSRNSLSLLEPDSSDAENDLGVARNQCTPSPRANVPPSELNAPEPLQTTIPAWGMSLILHLVVLIGFALLVPTRHVPQGIQEETRPASIVLVENAADRAEAKYFSEESTSVPTKLTAEAASTSERAASDAEVATPAAEEALTELLPAAPAPVSAAKTDIGRPFSEFKGAGRNIAANKEGAVADAKRIAAEQAALHVEAPTGPTAKVSVFGSAPAEGRTFCFVIDRSSSMGDEGLAVLGVAAEQLQAAVNALGPTHKFQIIAYNQRPMPLGPRSMTLATDENKQLVRKFFLTVGAYGSTDHELAMVGALAAKPDVLFLLTDGGDPFITPGQFKRLRDMAKGRTTIHCIQFGKGPPIDEGEHFMRQLSAETGGSYTYVDVNR